MKISEELCDFYWGSRSLTEENFGYCSSYSRQEIFLSFFYLCNFVGALKTIVFGVFCSSLKKILGEDDDEQ